MSHPKQLIAVSRWSDWSKGLISIGDEKMGREKGTKDSVWGGERGEGEKEGEREGGREGGRRERGEREGGRERGER